MIRADEKKAAREVKLLLLGEHIFCIPASHREEYLIQVLMSPHRRWRKWKINSTQADAIDIRPRIFEGREGRMAWHHIQQYPECFQSCPRCDGGA
jgi:hypothetical protein